LLDSVDRTKRYTLDRRSDDAPEDRHGPLQPIELIGDPSSARRAFTRRRDFLDTLLVPLELSMLG